MWTLENIKVHVKRELLVEHVFRFKPKPGQELTTHHHRYNLINYMKPARDIALLQHNVHDKPRASSTVPFFNGDAGSLREVGPHHRVPSSPPPEE